MVYGCRRDKMNNDVFHFVTPIGKIIGQCKENLITIKGVPYAKAKRFEMPVMVEKVDELEAKEPGPACPQHSDPYFEAILGGNGIKQLQQDENCQSLSIYRPKDHEGMNLPVMVWIHGGGYIGGAGDDATLDPGLIALEQEVMVVTVSYRLGIFGFLGDYLERPANLGLHDLIAALQWIKKNIESFGGDSLNVTLFGQSAGGDAIAQLMISDGTKGLFQKVIIQSAPLGIIFGKDEMREKMKQVATKAKEGDSAEHLLRIQKEILKAAQGFGLKSGMPFGPQYGLSPLPKEPEAKKEWRRRASEYDLMIGYTKEETSVFVPAMKELSHIWSMPLLGLYLKKLFIKVTTRKVYGYAAHQFAKNYSKGGGKVVEYKLMCKSKNNELGAAHTIDLPLLFGQKETWKNATLLEGVAWDDVRRQGKVIRKIWGDFAKHGHHVYEGKRKKVIKLW